VKIIKPSIVLVKPQLPENIGLVARAMDNCGLENLIIVQPREKWPNNIALKSSANSNKIIKNAKFFLLLEDALSEFNFVVATSNRKRFLQKPSIDNTSKLFDEFQKNKRIAIMFGPENSGLSNEDLMLADLVFRIDTANTNSSLNLSHAVLLVSFAWREYFFLKKIKPKNKFINNKALMRDFNYFMKFLKKELNEVGFLYPEKKSESMFNNIQTMLLRASLSKTELQTLWGMIKKLRK
tara:strand:- start:1279 stop:1992 length:714 start_codon:yes stop_codon:yes gene_type:complete